MATRRFYTVDRGNHLRAGQSLRLQRVKDAAARRWFPAGLSNHGRDFVLGEDADAEGIRIETLLELLRRDRYASKPSRLQSFFAFGSVSEARRFRREKDEGDSAIWEVSAVGGHRGDMTLLVWQDDLVGNLSWAEQYWQGRASSRPRWEYLLRPPVKVRRRVDSGK